jgi:DNA repair ATPase RecN
VKNYVLPVQERSAVADTRLNEALESIENQAYVINSLRSGLEDTNTNLAASLDRADTAQLRLQTLAETVAHLDLEDRFATKTALRTVEERLSQVADTSPAAPKDLEERLGRLAASWKSLDLAVSDVRSRGDSVESQVKDMRQQLEGIDKLSQQQLDGADQLSQQAEELKALQSKVGF